MVCALQLSERYRVTVFERNDRLGKKLSQTGNGQGNVTNVNMGVSYYFSDDLKKVEGVLSRFDAQDTVRFFENLGGLFLPDARGRVYPASRQASAVTDLLRGELARQNIDVRLSSRITQIQPDLTVRGENVCEKFDGVVLCAGGMAAPNCGTDGNGYELAKKLGHTVTPCTPSLVQLRCNPDAVRGLKGIRVEADLLVTRKGKEEYRVRGDVLFTESGVSGDAVFRASAYAQEGDILYLDFLPDVDGEKLRSAALKKGELLCIVNNGLARTLTRAADGDIERACALIKTFPLTVTGTLGFAYAQVTKGGIPLFEVDENLMSKTCKNLFFAGEILNVDGACGGYNLQWAFASAHAVAEGVKKCL